jgi:hypothetical protein
VRFSVVIPIPVEFLVGNSSNPGGIVKQSLAMVFSGAGQTIAKACGLDDATRRYEAL